MDAKQYVMFEIHASDLEPAGRFYTRAFGRELERLRCAAWQLVFTVAVQRQRLGSL
jgi:predicted enzyme related to lactoylglutathione lyase